MALSRFTGDLGFVDPYHRIDFVGDVYAQYRQAPDVVVTGYEAEPRNWNTFMSVGRSGSPKGFSVSVLSPNGGPATFSPYLELTERSLTGASGRPSKGEAIGGSWHYWPPSHRIDVHRYAKDLTARLGSRVHYFTGERRLPSSGRGILSVTSGDLLGLLAFEHGSADMVRADFEFSSKATMTVQLLEKDMGRYLAKTPIQVGLAGIRKELLTDGAGRIRLLYLDAEGAPVDGAEVTVSARGASIALSIGVGGSLSFPIRRMRSGPCRTP